MADYEVIARASIRSLAARAFKRHKGRDFHGFNLGSAAIETFQLEYDRLTSAASVKCATAAVQRFDARQASQC